jgi:DUF2075 family protein
MRSTFGWAGSIGDFLSVTDKVWLNSLSRHHVDLFVQDPSQSQIDAWVEEHSIIFATLRTVCIAQPSAVEWSVAFEYELPLEGGRRPDVVLLAGGNVLVLEFKQATRAESSALDQVDAYARDLAEYHKETHGVDVTPILVLTRAKSLTSSGRVIVTDPEGLPSLVLSNAGEGCRDLAVWLDSPYEPLPFLVDAARMIFNNEPLPAIRRALSSGIPEAISALEEVLEEGEKNGGRHLGLVSGVPGSGKTLTGLSLVYGASKGQRNSTFLSGNGPLVEVLQDALKSKVFVRDLHKYVKQFGLTSRVPSEHVIVFDEAQRMWDADMVEPKHGVRKSEPDLLISIAERLDRWAVLVGLIGGGQEIHAGEEGGIELWDKAVQSGSESWSVTCAQSLASSFPNANVRINNSLDLSVSLRSHQASYLHQWVSEVLDGEIEAAARSSIEIRSHAFPLYVTRDLEQAKRYVVSRYEADPDARYGILASSKSDRILKHFGIDSSFPATKRVRIAPWYNTGRGNPQSGCELSSVVTEFGCQGLELDFPIVAWSDDYRWDGTKWRNRFSRSRYVIHDPFQLRKNVYRVLMTRGRDGLLVFVPSHDSLDATYHILLAAGMQVL